MFYGVSHVDLAVSNLARSRRFYAEGLGFPVIREGTGFCDLDANSMPVLMSTNPTATHSGTSCWAFDSEVSRDMGNPFQLSCSGRNELRTLNI